MPDGSTQLGKYRLLGRIGFGGMAEVWVAHQQGPAGFEKLVAIKRLLPHMESEKQFIRMFLDEARIAARISHANVVQIFDLGLVDEKFYIAMEYLAGESLARVMGEGIKRGKPLTVPMAAMVVSQMCKGLHNAHMLRDNDGKLLGLVHRDVSPQNVMVLYDGGVKMLDFGIAKARERLSETTITGLKGKYSYMSPEQCMGQPVDRRSDIFACGTVFWEVLARRRLFKHTSKLMVLKMITEGRSPPPSKMNSGVLPELDQICLKALCKLPDQRFGSALEMSTAIDEALVSAGIAASTAQLAGYMEEVFKTEQSRRSEWISEATASSGSHATFQPADHWLDMLPDSTTVVSFSKSPVGTSVGKPIKIQSPIWWILAAVIATLAATTAIILLLTIPSAPGTRLRLSSTPPGANIIVDGKLQTRQTPGDIGPLGPGVHRVELILEGHLPWRRRVALEEGETLRIEAWLRPKVKPIDARVVTKTDTRAPPRSLSREDARSSVRAAPDARAVEIPARPHRPPRPVPPRRPKEPTPPPPEKVKEHGLLNLATRPWATIYHGRKKLGNTPLVRIKLPVGTIKLRAVNPGAGVDTTFTVEIKRDQLTRKAMRFDQAPATPR